MNKLIRAACIQFNAGADPERNWTRLLPHIQKAVKLNCRLIALPEVFAWRGPSEKLWDVAKNFSPLLIQRFQLLAKKTKKYFLLGSLLIPVPKSKKVYNTSLLIDADGKIQARYHKIHLFDMAWGKVKSSESERVRAGKKPVMATVDGIKVGLSVCYDLRFPELYRLLGAQGAQILCVPANFTAYTGRAHWETLVRARAIENQAFVLAPAQTGIHPGTGVKSYGNSLLVDPWGTILAQGDERFEGVLFADLDLAYQEKLRKQFPVLEHRRL